MSEIDFMPVSKINVKKNIPNIELKQYIKNPNFKAFIADNPNTTSDVITLYYAGFRKRIIRYIKDNITYDYFYEKNTMSILEKKDISFGINCHFNFLDFNLTDAETDTQNSKITGVEELKFIDKINTIYDLVKAIIRKYDLSVPEKDIEDFVKKFMDYKVVQHIYMEKESSPECDFENYYSGYLYYKKIELYFEHDNEEILFLTLSEPFSEFDFHHIPNYNKYTNILNDNKSANILNGNKHTKKKLDKDKILEALKIEQQLKAQGINKEVSTEEIINTLLKNTGPVGTGLAGLAIGFGISKLLD